MAGLVGKVTSVALGEVAEAVPPQASLEALQLPEDPPRWRSLELPERAVAAPAAMAIQLPLKSKGLHYPDFLIPEVGDREAREVQLAELADLAAK